MRDAAVRTIQARSLAALLTPLRRHLLRLCAGADGLEKSHARRGPTTAPAAGATAMHLPYTQTHDSYPRTCAAPGRLQARQKQTGGLTIEGSWRGPG